MRPYSLNLRSVRSDLLNNKAIELLKLIQRGVFSVFFVLLFNIQFSMNKSYSRNHFLLMEPSGIEPLTSCVQSRRSPS